jgi:hypothetical protein
VTSREFRLELAKFSEDFREGDHVKEVTAVSGRKGRVGGGAVLAVDGVHAPTRTRVGGRVCI